MEGNHDRGQVECVMCQYSSSFICKKKKKKKIALAYVAVIVPGFKNSYAKIGLKKYAATSLQRMILVLLRQNRTWCHPDGEETAGVKHGGHQAKECKKNSGS